MKEKLSPQYNDAVRQIKTAILQSQAKALASVNQEQLALYYGIGRYISQNSRSGFWGKDAIETISRQLSTEMPGLRGFPPRNLRNMRMFYEQWQYLNSNLAVATAKLESSENKENTIRQLLRKIDTFCNAGSVGSYFRIFHASQSITPSILFSTSSGSSGKKSKPVMRSTSSTVRQ